MANYSHQLQFRYTNLKKYFVQIYVCKELYVFKELCYTATEGMHQKLEQY